MRSVAPDEAVAERDDSLELLRAVRDELGLDAEMLSVAATSVGSGIKDAAEKLEADLIVVGSCHPSAIGRFMSGNDATSALHHAPCTVAIAPHGYASGGAAIGAVGVAYDGSSQSAAALAEARLLGEDLAATIRALDVEEITIRGYNWAAPYVEGCEILISNARRRLGPIAGVDLQVLVGQTGEELGRFSDEVDVLFCGSRGRSPLKRVMPGSTSDYLVRNLRSPIVIVAAVVETADPGTAEELACANAEPG